MIVLYAVARRDPGACTTREAVVPKLGLDAYDDADLVVLHRERERSPEPATAELLDYGSVLRALAAEWTVLPMRFGTVVDDSTALARMVDRYREEWSSRLTALADRSELIVHLPEAVPAPAPAASTSAGGGGTGTAGRDYLSARAATVHQEQRILARIDRLPGVVASRTLPPREGRRLSLLAENHQLEAVRAGIARWSAEEDLPELTVTGPWPPFSFCEVTRAQ